VLVQDAAVPASGGGVMQAWSEREWAELLAAVKQGVTTIHPAVDRTYPGVVFGLHRHEKLTLSSAAWDRFVREVRADTYDFDELSSPAATMGVGAGAAGPDGTGRPSEAAAGAGGLGPPSAPVAADVLGPSPVKPRGTCGASSGHDAGLLTDGESVLPGAAHTHFSGPNVAAMHVPAGRDHLEDPTAGEASGAIATTGQPGPDVFTAEDVEVDYLAEVITEAWEKCIQYGSYSLARYILEAGYRRDPVRPAVMGPWREEAASALKWGSGPLVHHVDEPAEPTADGLCRCEVCVGQRASRGDGTAEATGGAPATAGVSGGSEAGPGFTPRGSGPAEPTGGVS
jgi:hypothetical protein